MWHFDINREICPWVYVVEKLRNWDDLHLRSHREKVFFFLYFPSLNLGGVKMIRIRCASVYTQRFILNKNYRQSQAFFSGGGYHLLRNQPLPTIRLDTPRQDEPDRFEAVKEDEPLRVIQDPYLGNQLYLMRWYAQGWLCIRRFDVEV